ncbi:MAG: YqeG family HAD IIIA-type phosphatase [Aphanocapsa feldmannii 288cV]|nr:MAG: YqeG family HAD IIIA-type phosphatase [Aphanocapsa feldmannii 288cV]
MSGRLALRGVLQPDWVVRGTVVTLPIARLRAMGIRGVVLDVDRTLLPRRCRLLPDPVRQWVRSAAVVMRLHLLSNNLDQDRIRWVGKELGLPGTAFARKPRRGKLRSVLATMDLPPHQVAMVGDRILTDVVAGNRLGLWTVLVRSITCDGDICPHDRLQRLEKMISTGLGADLRESLPQQLHSL